MDFHIMVYVKYNDMVSDFTLQLNFKKLLFVEIHYSGEEKYQRLSKNTVNILLFSISCFVGEGGEEKRGKKEKKRRK